MGTRGYKKVSQGGGRLVHFKMIVSSTVTYLIKLTLGKFSIPCVHIFHTFDKLCDSVAFQLSKAILFAHLPFYNHPTSIIHLTFYNGMEKTTLNLQASSWELGMWSREMEELCSWAKLSIDMRLKPIGGSLACSHLFQEQLKQQ